MHWRCFLKDSKRFIFDSFLCVNQSASGLYCATSIARITLIVSALKPVVIIRSAVLLPDLYPSITAVLTRLLIIKQLIHGSSQLTRTETLHCERLVFIAVPKWVSTATISSDHTDQN